MKKVLSLCLVAILAMACLFAGGSKDSSAPAASAKADDGKSTVNIALTVDMGDMDPFAPPSSGRNYLRYSVYDYVAVFHNFGDNYLEMDWQLAKDIRQTGEATYEVEIYDYVKDAIGNPITAEDVVWCFETYIASGNIPRLRTYIKEIKVLDPVTFEITLTTTKVGSVEYCFAQVGVVARATYEAHKDTMSKTPITSGPYQIVESVTGSKVVLEKNENYWQTDESLRSYNANQQVDRMVYNVIKEPAQVTISLQTGENDMVTSLANSELQYFFKDGKEVAGYHVDKSLGGTSNTIHFNLDPSTPFAGNLALRKAVLYAFDSNMILKGAYRGEGEVIKDIGVNICSDYDTAWDSADYYDYNPEKAKELLVEAGYPGGIDPKTGKALVIRLMGDTEHQDSCVILQSFLLAIGLDCQLNIYDNALAASYVFDPSMYDMCFTYHGSEGYVVNPYDQMFGLNAEGKSIRIFYNDPELNRLLDAATNTNTHSKETVKALHDYVYENAYGVGVLANYSYVVSTDNIGIVRHPWGQLIGAACDYSDFI